MKGCTMMATIKQRLASGENILGTMTNILSHPDLPKIFKTCGLDYFIIDCEHGCYEYNQVAAMIAVAKEIGVAAMVRVPMASREPILRFMEMGADGLMLPNADTPEEARKLVEYAKYSPMGKRGMSMMRGHNRYIPVTDTLGYMKEANENTILIAQIESPEGVANIDDILAVEGIDIAFMGPNDLCNNLGVTGNQNAPCYLESVEKVIEASKRHGKACGTHGMNVDILKHWESKGMQFNLYSNEVSMIMNDAGAAVKAMKQ